MPIRTIHKVSTIQQPQRSMNDLIHWFSLLFICHWVSGWCLNPSIRRVIIQMKMATANSNKLESWSDNSVSFFTSSRWYTGEQYCLHIHWVLDHHHHHHHHCRHHHIEIPIIVIVIITNTVYIFIGWQIELKIETAVSQKLNFTPRGRVLNFPIQIWEREPRPVRQKICISNADKLSSV